jgi:hypothetical protein
MLVATAGVGPTPAYRLGYKLTGYKLTGSTDACALQLLLLREAWLTCPMW